MLVLQADIANQQGKTGSAIEFLKTAISLDPSSAEAAGVSGMLLLLQSRLEATSGEQEALRLQARQRLETAIELKPDLEPLYRPHLREIAAGSQDSEPR